MPLPSFVIDAAVFVCGSSCFQIWSPRLSIPETSWSSAGSSPQMKAYCFKFD